MVGPEFPLADPQRPLKQRAGLPELAAHPQVPAGAVEQPVERHGTVGGQLFHGKDVRQEAGAARPLHRLFDRSFREPREQHADRRRQVGRPAPGAQRRPHDRLGQPVYPQLVGAPFDQRVPPQRGDGAIEAEVVEQRLAQLSRYVAGGFAQQPDRDVVGCEESAQAQQHRGRRMLPGHPLVRQPQGGGDGYRIVVRPAFGDQLDQA